MDENSGDENTRESHSTQDPQAVPDADAQIQWPIFFISRDDQDQHYFTNLRDPNVPQSALTEAAIADQVRRVQTQLGRDLTADEQEHIRSVITDLQPQAKNWGSGEDSDADSADDDPPEHESEADWPPDADMNWNVNNNGDSEWWDEQPVQWDPDPEADDHPNAEADPGAEQPHQDRHMLSEIRRTIDDLRLTIENVDLRLQDVEYGRAQDHDESDERRDGPAKLTPAQVLQRECIDALFQRECIDGLIKAVRDVSAAAAAVSSTVAQRANVESTSSPPSAPGGASTSSAPSNGANNNSNSNAQQQQQQQQQPILPIQYVQQPAVMWMMPNGNPYIPAQSPPPNQQQTDQAQVIRIELPRSTVTLLALAVVMWTIISAILLSERLSDSGVGTYVNSGINGLGTALIFESWGAFVLLTLALVYLGASVCTWRGRG
jgi:hypothetical protein